MKQFFTISFLVFLHIQLFAQLYSQKENSARPRATVSNSNKSISFNGQWKGSFTDNSSAFGNDKIDYVLELECNGTIVTGYSYTYFSGGAKRYYTICKIKGTLNKATREVVVTEYERTKFNTPPEERNCFQTHTLKYVNDSDDVESLEGSWTPAPDQTGGCGFGKTLLTRRLMKNIIPVNTPAPKVTVTNTANAKKNIPPKNVSRPAPPPLALKQKPALTPQNKKPATVIKPSIKEDVARNDNGNIKNSIPILTAPAKSGNQTMSPQLNFEKRSKSLMKTIELQKDSFNVQLYDNGEIDGDSVSVFYNGSLLLSHKRLSDKPIELTLSLNRSLDVNELTIYAENLGTIPPNTALMIVTAGDQRFEVRITSDTEKNGTIAFVRKN